MAKPIIRYKPVAMEDRVNHKTIFVPTIVDRDQMIGLDDIIIRAIDHGRIVGVKAEAASGLANGIASQMYSEFCDGNGIKFGNYFYGQLHLKGTTTEDGRLTDENELHVTLYKGKGFALDRDMFTFQNVEAADVPSLDFAMSYADGAERNKLFLADDVMLYGSKMTGDDTTTSLKFWKCNESGVPQGDPTVIQSGDMSVCGPALIRVGMPGTAVVGKGAFQVVRTNTETQRETVSQLLVVDVVNGD
jgi:hypothetical protein